MGAHSCSVHLGVSKKNVHKESGVCIMYNDIGRNLTDLAPAVDNPFKNHFMYI